MKLTKLIALLLAMFLLVGCFASCDMLGGSVDDDEKIEENAGDEKDNADEDDKNDADDKATSDDEEEKDEDEGKDASSEDGIVGDWSGTVDYADLLYAQAELEVDVPLIFSVNFELSKNGEYVMSYTAPDEDEAEAFIDAYADAMIVYVMDLLGVDTEDELEQYILETPDMGYDSLDEYKADILSAADDEITNQLEYLDDEEEGEYTYEDGLLVFDDEIEFEITFEGDTFVIDTCSELSVAMFFEGVEFERQ